MILEVNDLNLYFKGEKQKKQILKNVSFSLEENKCLGILGESGSGKSMLWKSLMGLLDENFHIDGKVTFNNCSLLNLTKEEKRQVRGKQITTIVQNPMTAFNPLFTLGNQMIETFLSHSKLSKSEAKDLSLDVLKRMNISDGKEVLKKYPHELSGGMLQRIMIGISIALNPLLIVADEPTTAIDSLNQVEVIKELKQLRKNMGVSMIFITHDLHVLSQIADDVIVMKDGQIVEKGSIEQIMKNPQNEQSKFLVQTRLKLSQRFDTCVKGECEHVINS